MTAEALRELILQSDLPGIQAALPLEPTLIDAVDADGVPLAMLAARESSLEVLRYLVEYGLRVNLNAVDSRGRDLLHYAAEGGDPEKCRYLMTRGGMDPLRGDLALVSPYDLAMDNPATRACFVQAVGAEPEELYHNPVRRGFFPDPSILRVGEDYYMVNSTFTFFPCIPVSHSRDLIHWEVVGHAIERAEWSALEGLEGGRGWWAPDISYAPDTGLFYICATLRLNDVGAVRRRQMVVTSRAPEGPYSEPVFFEEDGIDPSLFHDDDGRHYMLLNRGARIFEIDGSATRRLSETTLLYYGSQKRAPEGPHLLKRDGWYYLFLAEGGTGTGHRETVARSRTLMGVYQPSPYGPVIRQWDERSPIQRCGHAKPVTLPDGRWAFVYLCGRPLEGRWTMMGRETALDAFTWTADGWPLLNEGRGVSTQARKLLLDALVPEHTDWLTPRSPRPGTIRWDGNTLTLRGDPFPLTDTRCRSVVLQRQREPRFAFEAALTVPGAGEAGLTCYYDEHSFLTAGVRDGALHVTEQIGLETVTHAPIPVALKPGDRLTLRVEVDGLRRTLLTRAGDGWQTLCALENVTYLSDEGVRIGKRFTGAMVGVYALGDTAVFEGLRYEET